MLVCCVGDIVGLSVSLVVGGGVSRLVSCRWLLCRVIVGIV